jgi:hypothetical protein
VVSPILGAYTVADAVRVMPALTVAMNVGNDERNNHALYEAQWLLEDFAATALASGPECVKARAELLRRALDDDGVLGDRGERKAAFSLKHDIRELIASKFDGELFGDHASGKRSAWLYRSLNERERLSTMAVDIMRDARTASCRPSKRAAR